MIATVFRAKNPKFRPLPPKVMFVKIVSICPNCFGSRVRQKIGSSLIKDGNVLKIADDMGEIVECPDCNHIGVDAFAGNDKLIAMLKVRKQWKESAPVLAETMAVETPAALPALSNADTEILTVQTPKLE